MIEVTVKLRYAPELPSEGYPNCLSEEDALAYDKRSFETGFIDLNDLISWSDAITHDGVVVNNAQTMDVYFEVVEAPDPEAIGTHL